MSAEAKPEIPPFSEAINQLKDFLAEQNLSSELLWVFREDVIYRKRSLFIKEPLSSENEMNVESLYEEGCQRGLGLRLETLCRLGAHPCCYIWLPKDQMDAEYSLLLMSKFIISVPTELMRAKSVRNPLVWRAYMLTEDEDKSRVDRLPRRNI